MGLRYQFIAVRRDKLSLLTFLLPLVAAIFITTFSGINVTDLAVSQFYIVENDLPQSTVDWLESLGEVTTVADLTSLKEAILDPASQSIGVINNRGQIKTILAGDELTAVSEIGRRLGTMYHLRDEISQVKQSILPSEPTNKTEIRQLLLAITIVTAVYMGCTYNATNIISEKEEGIVFINQVLPLSKLKYLVQKMSLGFVAGGLSGLLTGMISIRISANQVVPFLAILLFSAVIASILGLVIGQLAGSLMVGLVYIKSSLMILIALPVLVYLTAQPSSLVYWVSYVLPSSASFYSLMNMLRGSASDLKDLLILLIHCGLWLVLTLVWRKQPVGVKEPRNK